MTRLMAMMFAIALVACGSKPIRPAAVLHYTITASAEADTNPDADGRPSPVVVRFYALDDADNFRTAAFEALYGDDQHALSGGWHWRHEALLMPGATQIVEASLPPSAQLCAFAAFRELRTSHWRACTALKADTPPRLQVSASAIAFQ